jgi:hypothetical protein
MPDHRADWKPRAPFAPPLRACGLSAQPPVFR